MRTGLILFGGIVLLAAVAKAGDVFESNGAMWIKNPYPDGPRSGNCCPQDSVEICSPQSVRYGMRDPGCALKCRLEAGQGPVPGYSRCQGTKCVCYG